jgi:predicted nucleotidyltransferase
VSLTGEQKRSIQKTMVLREAKAALDEKKLRFQARQRALAVADYLMKNYSLKRIYLYGSLASDDHFDIHSDIDLFIVGWDEEYNYWSMLSKAEKIAEPFVISIATEKDALPSLVDSVYKEGRLII